jgi:hypothetical protein
MQRLKIQGKKRKGKIILNTKDRKAKDDRHSGSLRIPLKWPLPSNISLQFADYYIDS